MTNTPGEGRPAEGEQQPGQPEPPGQYGPPPPYPQPPSTQPPYGMPGYGTAPYPQQYGASGYGPPPYPPQPPSHPRATTALVLGIVALVGGTACLLPILLAPFAWVIGRNAVREIDASHGQLGGRGSAQAGTVLGIIGTVLLVLGIVGFILVLTVIAVTSPPEITGPMPADV